MHFYHSHPESQGQLIESFINRFVIDFFFFFNVTKWINKVLLLIRMSSVFSTYAQTPAKITASKCPFQSPLLKTRRAEFLSQKC